MKKQTITCTEADILSSNIEKCSCGNVSEMHPICVGTYDSRTHDDLDWAYSRSTYKVLVCPACHSTFVIRYTGYGDDNDVVNGSFTYTFEKEILYGPPKQRHHSIPPTITDVVNQAETVIINSPRAAFILCRAALEEICRERDIQEIKTDKKGNNKFISLYDKLNALIEQENLSNELKEIVHGIRLLGNESAHSSQVMFTQKISIEDVEALLNLVDYVLDRLYVDKYRSEEAMNQLNQLKKIITGDK